MKIGIVSDTHKNRDMLEKVTTWLTQRQKVTTLYHLGDDYDDVADLGEEFSELIQIPGIYDPRYKSGELPATQTEVVFGLTILLVHSLDKDATRDDIHHADIILHGHTHKQELRLEDGKLFFNPGHLKGPLDKNMPPTFGILSIQDNDVSAAIYNLDFKVVHSIDMIRSESGLYRAR